MGADPAELAARIHESRKYRFLCPDVVARTAAWAAERHPSAKAAVKAAKRKLHQIYGAYLDGWKPEEADHLLDSLGDPSGEGLRVACRRIMALHSSTRERLPALEGIYPELFALTGTPGSILDIGCGLHPFGLPWMGLPPDTRYEAWEIDTRMVALLRRFLALAGQPGEAHCRDLLSRPPEGGYDVVFLLKMIPCLEQQRRRAAVDVLGALDARHVVASFPTRSLGGWGKGMRAHYGALMESITAELGCRATAIERPQELFYVLEM